MCTPTYYYNIVIINRKLHFHYKVYNINIIVCACTSVANGTGTYLIITGTSYNIITGSKHHENLKFLIEHDIHVTFVHQYCGSRCTYWHGHYGRCFHG